MNESAKVDEGLNVESVVDWMVNGARTAKLSQEILEQLCERLVESGLPLFRVAVFVTTLHPNVMGRGFFWRRDEGVSVGEAPYSVQDTEEYKNNPIFRIYRDGAEIRRRIGEADCPDDFKILGELKADGVTDYIAMPLDFTNGEIHAVSYTTRRDGGFSDAEIAALQRVRSALSRLAGIFALKRIARNLLDAYLGRQSGEKVLAGQIKRGDGEDIHAVIWFCDLRGSTPLADAMSRAEFLDLLNDYFECMAGAVLDADGEVFTLPAGG